MEIRNVRSIQRVVNFMIDDGKMLQQEHDGTTIPGVTMLCDLPLLFTNGLPTCLDNLTVGQLEEFVPYMIQCSGIRTRTKPRWWPEEVDFSGTLEMSGLSEVKWLECLKKLVASCYSYHGCEYALRLCVDPLHTCRTSKWTNIRELGDNMPQCDKATRLQLSPIRTRNVLNYERKRTSSNASLQKITNISKRQKNSPIQIYLCDSCGSEFCTSKEIQNHEKICFQKRWSLESHVPSHNPVNTCTTLIHCSSKTLKKQTTSKSLISRSAVPQPMSVSVILTKEYGHDCKKCGKLFVSFESLHDHEASCPKRPLQNTTNFASPNMKMGSQSNESTKERLSTCNISFHANNSNIDHNSIPSRKKRMRLLPMKESRTSDCIKLPQDILVCNDCDKEFMSSTDIKNHEVICSGKRRELAPSPVFSVREAEHIEGFLKYFELTVATQLHSLPIAKSTLRSRRCFGNPLRYSAIPISSPLGCQIHGSPVPIIAVLTKMEKVERYCSAKPYTTYPPVDEKFNAGLWRISWKPRKIRLENSTHEYKYPLQRWWRMPSLYKTKLEIKGRNQTLQNLCRPLQIKIRKLSLQEIESYTSCRPFTLNVRKLSSEEILLYTNSCSVSPKLKRLSAQVIEVYTGQCSIAPKVRRLSFQEIEKHAKPRT